MSDSEPLVNDAVLETAKRVLHRLFPDVHPWPGPGEPPCEESDEDYRNELEEDAEICAAEIMEIHRKTQGP